MKAVMHQVDKNVVDTQTLDRLVAHRLPQGADVPQWDAYILDNLPQGSREIVDNGMGTIDEDL